MSADFLPFPPLSPLLRAPHLVGGVEMFTRRSQEAQLTNPALGAPLRPGAAGGFAAAVAEVKETSILPMLTVDMENKENGSLDVKNSVENGRPPDPADWAVIDVVNYFRTAGFEEQANAFQEQEIDGKSLLLMTRNDVLTGLSLKLGPALKIYEYHVKPLQTQHLKNNSL
ncbi:sterile alpha motif domain-containing protein 13 isoform X1 [Columba livia]|uniref:sterile alpha motif domain-containing protein 13 isoform X1 n=1 Tax=Columba livia TaxID=8932 RepID=UPI0031BB1512